MGDDTAIEGHGYRHYSHGLPQALSMKSALNVHSVFPLMTMMIFLPQSLRNTALETDE